MASVNYRGVEAICKYIESTGLSHFAIYPAGRSQSKPLYKQTLKGTPAKAAERFKDWADVILSGDPNHTLDYELRMSEGKEIEGTDEVDLTGGRSGMMVTFNLLTQTPQAQAETQRVIQQPQSGISMEMYLLLMDAKNDAQRECDRLRFENTNLKKQVLELEEALEEMDEPVEDNGIGAIGNMMLPHLMKVFAGAQVPSNPINGFPEHTETEKEEFSPRLRKAIAQLRKYDDDLDTDLILLGQIAEKQPAHFKMLIEALRNA